MSKVFSRKDVSQHNKRDDCWVIIRNDVFNLTKFVDLHPGGVAFIVENAGKDVTELFDQYHHADVLRKYAPRLHVGTLKSEEQPKVKRPAKIPGAFGDLVPYGDPAWYQRLKSPYYKPTHIAFRKRVREFVEKEIMPTMPSWCDGDKPPRELYKKMGREGFLACMHGPPFPGQHLPKDVPVPENFDYFHELILFDEISRIAHPGAIAAITNGPAIGVSAIMRFGSEAMKKRVSQDVFLGEKFIALAISEPSTGSDVAAIATRAVKSADGKHYIVKGLKKWITNGTYADYFVTAVRTSDDPHKGLSFLLVERSMEGFTSRKIGIRGSDISGTALLEFDNVKVPVENLIGRENDGFKYIMHNFNHERFYVSILGGRMSRICVEESIKYALKRKAFGKTLSEQPVIRAKIAKMVRHVEQYHAWLEFVAFQLCSMTHAEGNEKLGDVLCLLKSQVSRTLETVARETTHIFGGNSMHMTGLGKRIEPMVNSVKGYAIPAGAEDVMDDFAARQAFRLALRVAKL
eukprot:PhM_4_TR7050/c0_g1_i1/m.84493